MVDTSFKTGGEFVNYTFLEFINKLEQSILILEYIITIIIIIVRFTFKYMVINIIIVIIVKAINKTNMRRLTA